MPRPFYLKKFLKDLKFKEIPKQNTRSILKWKRDNIIIERHSRCGLIFLKILINNEEFKKYNISSCINNQLHNFKKDIQSIN